MKDMHLRVASKKEHKCGWTMRGACDSNLRSMVRDERIGVTVRALKSRRKNRLRVGDGQRGSRGTQTNKHFAFLHQLIQTASVPLRLLQPGLQVQRCSIRLLSAAAAAPTHSVQKVAAHNHGGSDGDMRHTLRPTAAAGLVRYGYFCSTVFQLHLAVQPLLAVLHKGTAKGLHWEWLGGMRVVCVCVCVCVLAGDGPGGMLRVQCGAGHWHRIQMRAHFLVAQARTNKQR